MIKIAPSILACDFTKLEHEIQDVERGGADLLHLDIMDGHFVPNITFGPIIVKAIRKLTELPLDAHLMISDPEKYVGRFIESGANKVTFHIEVEENPTELASRIRNHGCKVGISLNPETPIGKLESFLTLFDSVLVMSVHPGFGGQQFKPDSYEKILALKKIKKDGNLHFDIEVDGGVNLENSNQLIKCGVNTLIAGTTIFHSKNREIVINSLRKPYE